MPYELQTNGYWYLIEADGYIHRCVVCNRPLEHTMHTDRTGPVALCAHHCPSTFHPRNRLRDPEPTEKRSFADRLSEGCNMLAECGDREL